MSTPETHLPRVAAIGPLIQRLGLGAVSLVAANTLLLFLYFWYDVTLFQLVLVYWCECVWIGVFSAVKLCIASIAGDPYENKWVDVSAGTSLFTSLALVWFAGAFFLSLLGVLLIAILYVNDVLPLGNPGDDWRNHIGLVLGASLLLMAAHAISLVANFLVGREYRTARAGELLKLPFTRCLALLLAIVVSIVFVVLVPTFANTTAFATVVIVVKVLWDIRLHRAERRMFDLRNPLTDPGRRAL